jgi:flagellar P-ring protein precursor FlgI
MVSFTIQSIVNMLKSMGVVVSASQLQTKNVAAVMVTAQLPPFVKSGDNIDITVSSMGDAKSLQGGTLVQTPLKAANGGIYAVGQGPVSIGGTSLGGSSKIKNFPTVAIITDGGIVERDVDTKITDNGSISLALNQPDYTTASRIVDAVSQSFGPIAFARDAGTVVLRVPPEYIGNQVAFIAAIEEVTVTPDNIAKVVINERTGTIVMGGAVTIDAVAVAQGGLTIRIGKPVDVTQQPPQNTNTNGTGSKLTDTNVTENHLIMLPASANVSDVVSALNAVGATPRDVISILQAMKAAGALRAELQLL